MFSLISLFFAYRRDVVLAERYVAGLTGPVAAPEATTKIEPAATADLPLAA